MSYSILYRSMFIKMSDGRFIPMMEMGDNNVWECNYGHGRNRRVRSWSNIRLNKKQKFFTEEEIRNFLEGWNNEFEDKRQKDLNSDDEWNRKMEPFLSMVRVEHMERSLMMLKTLFWAALKIVSHCKMRLRNAI